MILVAWRELTIRFSSVILDAMVIMPNHFHGIIHLGSGAVVGAGVAPAVIGVGTRPAPITADNNTNNPNSLVGVGVGLVPTPTPTRDTPTLGSVIGAFKSITTVRYINGVRRHGWPEFHRRIWQRNYYEHIIRHEYALERIRRYIELNPAKWERDRENQHSIPKIKH